MKKHTRQLLSLLLVIQLFLPVHIFAYAQNQGQNMQELRGDLTGQAVVINPVDYGADPSGKNDSAAAIWNAFEAAREATENGAASVTVDFPKGEYHIYKDYVQQREYHTSNTNSIENPNKWIGILIENQKDFTMEGNGSLFMMHGDMMALAVVKSENVTLHNFSWDFAVPTVSEMNVVGMGNDGAPYTDFYIPACFPYQISGNTMIWTSERSPYTGQYYWTETGIHNAYSVVAYQPEEEMSRAYFTNQGPFQNATRIQQLADNTVRVYYSSRPAMQKQGMIFELCSSAVRKTAGAFFWESKDTVADSINVHYMHGFGWLSQMCDNVTYRNCNFMPREGTGKHTVSYADAIHASGSAGDFIIENCNFANSHDDPINMHGTFTRVERRIDDHTLQLNYIHNQQGGFPQYHVGDKVVFYTRDLLTSTDNETEYTVSEVVSNPGESGNNLRTMVIRFEEALPANLSDKVSGQPKYVCENITYAPKVTIRGCTFKNVTTRGILCTTRNPVLIEDNTFLNMSMATIYLSNDSDEWYESGPIRDMTIRNNTFYIKSIGRTSWEYAPAIYIHPVTKGGGLPAPESAIHKNISIEENTFYMDLDCVVKAESVENLTIRNNHVLRYNPDVTLSISADARTLQPGASLTLDTEASANSNTGTAGQGNTPNNNYDNLYEFTKCKNVVIEGNTYDDGLKEYAVLRGSGDSADEIHIQNDPVTVTTSRNGKPTAPIYVQYATTNASVATVDENGVVTAVNPGEVDVYAYYEWNGSVLRSEPVHLTVEGSVAPAVSKVSIQEADNLRLEAVGATQQFTAAVEGAEAAPVWTVTDLSGNATQAASIDQSGLLTAQSAGVVMVKASVGAVSDSRTVIVSPVHMDGLRPDFSIVREDTTSYELGADGSALTMVMRNTDLYQTDNNAQVFLFDIPSNVDSSDFWTAVHVDNLPVRKSNAWDTASFLLYRNDDNYLSIGKKCHFDGFAAVTEQNAKANEIGQSNTTNNAVSSADLAFRKNGDTVTMYYKVAGGEWTQWQGTSASSLSAAPLGDSFKIGFAVWGSIGAGTRVTFSNFRVADGSEVASAADLDGLEQIAFTGYENQAPSASNAAFGNASYAAGDTVTVSYAYSDAEAHAEAGTLYKWTTKDAAGNTTVQITDVPSYTASTAGTLTCTIYPRDQYGAIGAAVSLSTEVARGGQADLALSGLSVNGTTVKGFSSDRFDYEVKVPGQLTNVLVGYASKSPADGSITVSVDGEAQAGLPNSGSLLVNVGSTVTLTRDDAHVYTLKITGAKDSAVRIDSISIPELSFEESGSIPNSTLAVTDADNRDVTMNIQAALNGGELVILRDEARTPVDVTENSDGIYVADLTLLPGLNSFYVQAIAQDGAVKEQRMVHVTRKASTDTALSGLTINGKALPDFDPSQTEYAYTLDSDSLSVKADLSDDKASCSITVNGVRTEGAAVSMDELRDGMNTIIVAVKADDGMSMKYYTVTAIAPNDANADLLTLEVTGAALSAPFDPDTLAYGLDIQSNALGFTAKAQQAGAIVAANCNGVLTYGTGSVTVNTADVYEGDNAFSITVLSADRSVSKTYTLSGNAQPVRYASELDWESATVGYGSIQLNRSSDGNKLTLRNTDGGSTAYEKGIGTHANSTILYNIAGAGYTRFQAVVGVDQEVVPSDWPNLVFQVKVDGTIKFTSDTLFDDTPAQEIDIELPADAQTIELTVTQAQNQNWSAHADWADAKFSTTLPQRPETDRAELNSAIFSALQLDKDAYTASSWAALEAALQAATALAPTASQADVDGALKAIETAVENLTKPSTGAHLLIATYSANADLASVEGNAEQILDIAGLYSAKVESGELLTFHFVPSGEERTFLSASLNGAEIPFTPDGCSYTLTMAGEDMHPRFVFTSVNKLVLRTAINTALGLKGGDEYNTAVETVRDRFDAALKAAQDAYAAPDATQEEVDKAWSDLIDAAQYLSFTAGNPAKLNALLETANALLEEDFTPETWAAFEEALATAKDAVDTDEPLEAELSKAYDDLHDAILALVYRADVSMLQMLVNEAEAINLDDYMSSQDVKNAFTGALGSAKELLKDANATQEEVDAAAKALNQAMTALRLTPSAEALAALLDDAEHADPAKYTAATYAALQAAIKTGREVLAKGDATEDEVSGIYTTVQKLLNSTVAEDDKPVKPTKPSGSKKSSAGKSNTYGSAGTAVVNPLVGAAQNVAAKTSVVSDTTVNFTLKRGSAYCFKMTVVNGNGAAPSFTAGNGGVLKTQFVAQIGNDYYYRVYAVGTPGQSTGVYTTLAGQNPVKHCAVTIN